MIRIVIDKTPPEFRPGEPINGLVQWRDIQSSALEVRMVWYTIGKGSAESEIVALHKIAPLKRSGTDPFRFTAPHRPQSFSGNLVSIRWALETIIFPDQLGVRMDLTISNTGKELKPAI
jgi:hypothetical protein